MANLTAFAALKFSSQPCDALLVAAANPGGHWYGVQQSVYFGIPRAYTPGIQGELHMQSALDQAVSEASEDFVRRLSNLNQDGYVRDAIMKLAIREVAGQC